jgi:hypothetical protein
MADHIVYVPDGQRASVPFPIDWLALLAGYPGLTLVQRLSGTTAIVRGNAVALDRMLADHAPLLAAAPTTIESFE